MKNHISKSDFQFVQGIDRQHIVTYTCPNTLQKWSKVVYSLPLINSVKNEENPTVESMEDLKRFLKY